MPTIQIKITDEEFSELQQLTGESTATKAIRYIINEYKRLSDLYPKAIQSQQATRQELDNIDNAIREFTTAFNRLTLIGHDPQE